MVWLWVDSKCQNEESARNRHQRESEMSSSINEDQWHFLGVRLAFQSLDFLIFAEGCNSWEFSFLSLYFGWSQTTDSQTKTTSHWVCQRKPQHRVFKSKIAQFSFIPMYNKEFRSRMQAHQQPCITWSKWGVKDIAARQQAVETCLTLSKLFSRFFKMERARMWKG